MTVPDGDNLDNQPAELPERGCLDFHSRAGESNITGDFYRLARAAPGYAPLTVWSLPVGTGTYTWNNPSQGGDLPVSERHLCCQAGAEGTLWRLVVGQRWWLILLLRTQEEILVYSEIDPVLNNAASGAGRGQGQ